MTTYTIPLEKVEQAVAEFYKEGNQHASYWGGPLEAVEIPVCKPWSMQQGDPLSVSIDTIRIERKPF